MNSSEVCRLSGATYRQLVFWIIKGYIKPSLAAPAGSGHKYLWSSEDAVQVTVMKHLVVLGFEPHRAAEHRADPETVEIGIDTDYVSIRIDVEAIRKHVNG